MMKNMVSISQLTKASEKSLAAINHLLPQLSEKETPLSLRDLKKILEQKDFFLFVAREGGKIIGMASMYITKLVSGIDANIDDVVVDEAYRGKGVGRSLMETLIERAGKEEAAYVDLTSKPWRVAANELYHTLGFEKRQTNVYRLTIAK